MPSYPAAKPAALYPGDKLALVNNAAVDAGVTTTIQAAVGPAPANSQGHFVAYNSSNESATIQSAPADANASYLTLYDGADGVTVAAGVAVAFDCPGPWIRATFGTAPTTGSLIIYRG